MSKNTKKQEMIAGKDGKTSTCSVEDSRGEGREVKVAWVGDQLSAGTGAEYAVDIESN